MLKSDELIKYFSHYTGIRESILTYKNETHYLKVLSIRAYDQSVKSVNNTNVMA